MKRLMICFAVVSVFFFGFRIADGDFIQQLRVKLAAFNKTYADERVYLQFDKTFYKPGEDIWYKAYVLDGSTLAPSLTSTVLYVELIDPRGSVIKKSELFVEEGTSHGDFAIQSNMAGGLYTIRAYTRWMHNFQEEAFFSKQIPVQSVVTPRLLLKLDFERKAYGKNDVVKAQLNTRNLKDEPLVHASIKATIKLQGNELAVQDFKTNENGEADITFQLPADLNTTDGLIQAIVSNNGIEESISRSVPIVLNKIQIRFFPEGGECVAGFNSKIAFEAINEFGKGADVEGIVTDENGRKVSTFASYHLGMGAFSINAEPEKKYFAKLTKPEGINEIFSLPASNVAGLSLSMESKNDSLIKAYVFSTYATQAYLVGHVHSGIVEAQKLNLKAGLNETIISTRLMPAGIAVFTLFDSEGKESCERLIFVNPSKSLHIELSTHQKEYLPGEKVEISIKTRDALKRPVSANLSLAVVDEQLLTFADDKQDNLLSWMLLGSELKGKIEEPSFYFDESEPKSKKALDYLLMVHGWRRFTWQEVSIPTQTLSYLPENNRNLSGIVLDNQNKNVKAEVILLELENRKRIAKLTTDKSGQFLFRNVDSSSPMLVVTKRPNVIEVNGIKSTVNDFDSPSYRRYGTRWIEPMIELEEPTSISLTQPILDQRNEDVNLSSDVSQLSEVVVVGYGMSAESKALGSSTSRVVRDLSSPFLLNQSVENTLAGRVAGIVISQSGQPGASTAIQLRGVSSLGNRSEPLWLINGVPLSGGINSNFTTGNQLSAAHIQSISVVKAAEAVALFGSAAANGAILVETKNRADYSNMRYVKAKSKYSTLVINPRSFTIAREFYSSPDKSKDARDNFKTTVFWNHSIVTDKNGEAKIQFNNNDVTSAFRITAEGITGQGLIGRKEATYHTLLPFSLDAKIPEFLGFEDTLKLPVRITNNTKDKVKAMIWIDIPPTLRTTTSLKQSIDVGANQTVTIPVSITSTSNKGKFPISISIKANKHYDEIKKTIEVHPVGFPVKASYSGKSLASTINITMQGVEKGSVKGEVVFVTDVLEDLFTGVDAMLREPHGCFEQVSSSTFPNILALQFLKQIGQSNSIIESRALDYIQSGYKMLKGYEINSGGFEWFGHPPAHEALTAFGLIEFMEMQKVFPGVDQRMIERTKNWLLERRDGKGGFKQNRGKYGFSAAPEAVNNAYLVYALSECGIMTEKEYNHSLEEAKKSQDMYRAALMASAALNYKRDSDYKLMIEMFNQATVKGFDALRAQSSITYSYGNSLSSELIALWTLALLKSPEPDYKQLSKCIEYLGTKKSFGMYGSTQATYLSLRAVTEYHKLVQRKRSDGEILLALNKSTPLVKSFTKYTKKNIVFNSFDSLLHDGNNAVKIAFQNTDDPLPYSINIAWNTKTPKNSTECKLKIETTLRKAELKLNETVRFTIKLTNQTPLGQPMSLAVVGIPAGLSLQTWQLKELSEKGVFDFYEIKGDKLAIYYRELGPSETKEINLDLKADFPGSYQSSASCAYLYYTDEHKNWAAGSKVIIK